ncbi:MAG: helix-turn-helix transcriptional regulator [Candidatus Heimdallarchaeota archaeon]|nr:helix-turn-helix transcriptional regulator [Candidatus Heimdallarchaeota archaeon]
MAILPVFQRVETKEIMAILLKGPKSASELNSILVLQPENAVCSTSTLYRRLKELHLASILEKDDDNRYVITNYGLKLYQDFNAEPVVITQTQEKVLKKFEEVQGKSDLLRSMSVSPNTLSQTIDTLIDEDLIEEVEKEQKPRGRPKKKYSLTSKGREALKSKKRMEKKARKK